MHTTTLPLNERLTTERQRERTLVDLRAMIAMRAEDTRIARKHREEAAGRRQTPANAAAYQRALRWETTCLEAEARARADYEAVA